jgi:hypothetical protein
MLDVATGDSITDFSMQAPHSGAKELAHDIQEVR